MRGGLTRRTIVASAVLALLVGAAFVVLVGAVTEERDSADLAIRSQEMIEEASRLELLVLDLETGQRGFIITHQERFLEPWQAARDGYRGVADSLVRASTGINGQARRAQEIAAAVDAYVTDFSVPLVDAAQRGEASASSGTSGRRLPRCASSPVTLTPSCSSPTPVPRCASGAADAGSC